MLLIPCTAQVRFVPFMSPAGHSKVLADHERKVAAGVKVHVNLSLQLREVSKRGRRASTSSNTGMTAAGSLRAQRTCLVRHSSRACSSM